MQIPQSVHTGDLVEIRRHRWLVLDVCAYECGQLLTVAGAGPGNAGTQRQFLGPFETIATLNRAQVPRFVRPHRWRRACRGLIADYTPPGGLRAAGRARIQLLPHQLQPAMAIVRGLGSRILLADDVGLGKTIEAGLIVSELHARGQAERILIVTPSGLRDQWRSELAERFDILAAVVDAGESRRRCQTIPVGMNPWITTPLAIVSIDYVKRPEVLQSVRACSWDVVVVDEAHGAGNTSERFAAVSALAARAAYVVLLTATPHNGDPRAFSSLCGIGALDDPLLVFRRARVAVNLGAGRRVHRLQVRPSAAELRMHALLGDFTRAVRSEHSSADAWLALSVLHKRAFSSPWSLELTVRRRLEMLGPEAMDGFRQMVLPLVDHGGELDDADESPDCLSVLALADSHRERLLLDALRDAARRAIEGESKVLALVRLLRRVPEPVVIFTEFRDTLLHLSLALGQPVVMLHGGLTRDERRAAVDDFTTGRCRILLATDAAGEGLNLHHRCRCIVNLELPWNPTRLEQRIGRVDRIGQPRIVHAVHFIARDTGECRVLDRLKARIARARQDIEAADPVDGEERAVARSIIDPERRDADADVAHPAAETSAVSAAMLAVDLRSAAEEEARRLRSVRALATEEDARTLARLDATGPWAARAGLGLTRARLGRRVLAIWRIDSEDGVGRLVDGTIVPVAIALRDCEGMDPDRMRAWLQSLCTTVQTFAENASDRPCALAAEMVRSLLSVRLAREKRIAQSVLGAGRPAFQPGLFDRRAEHVVFADARAASEAETEINRRLHTLERSSVVSLRPARLLLVLVP
jgi:superfamily II DNA or RNA helicase